MWRGAGVAALAWPVEQACVEPEREAPGNHLVAVVEEVANTWQAECRSDLAHLVREIAISNAALDRQLATTMESVPTARWWQTAVLPGGMGIITAAIIVPVA